MPLKKTNVTTLERIITTLPWRGKCFYAAAPGETVAEPTSGDGTVLPAPVPLISRVINRLDEGDLSPSSRRGDDAADFATNTSVLPSAEQLVAPAVVYEGESSLDGLPALIVDYHGMEDFSTFRDEMRYVGCGVWLGKTYLTGPPDTMAESLASVAGVNLDNPLMITLITKAMPTVTPDAPLPHVLNFVIFQTAEAQSIEDA